MPSPDFPRIPSAPSRRQDLDWLRIGACYLLLLFHVLMVFNPAPFYHVRNSDQSSVAMILTGFIHLWHMPLLFLLAGWSLHASLASRGAAPFLTERVKKLAVPLVAGCILLAPGIKYLELESGLDLNHTGLYVSAELQESFLPVAPDGLPLAAPFDESFVGFLPTFFTDLDRFSWSHLWFIAYLFVFTIVLLPLLMAFRRFASGTVLTHRAWIYAPLVPLLAVQVGLRMDWPGPYNLYADWANVGFYATFLWVGFALFQFPGLEAAIENERKRLLGLGLGSAALLILPLLGLVDWPPLLLVGFGVSSWCLVAAILGFARAHLRVDHSALPYLSESAYPVYLFHQPAIVALGFLIVTLPLGVYAKFVLLLSASTALTLGWFHFAVRPFTLPRLLCGMKPQAPSSHRVSSPTPAPLRDQPLRDQREAS